MTTPEQKFVQGFLDELDRRAEQQQPKSPIEDRVFMRKLDNELDWANRHYGCQCRMPNFT